MLVALCRPLKDSAYAAPATNKDIADEVHLSVDAVKAHLRVLFERFGLDDLPQNQKRARLAADGAGQRRGPAARVLSVQRPPRPDRTRTLRFCSYRPRRGLSPG